VWLEEGQLVQRYGFRRRRFRFERAQQGLLSLGQSAARLPPPPWSGVARLSRRCRPGCGTRGAQWTMVPQPPSAARSTISRCVRPRICRRRWAGPSSRESAHRPQQGLQPPMISLDRVVGVLLDGVQGRGDQLIEDPRIGRGPPVSLPPRSSNATLPDRFADTPHRLIYRACRCCHDA
jgi:hypothetical protein